MDIKGGSGCPHIGTPWPELTYHPYLCGDQRPADMIARPIIHPTLDQPDHTSDRKGQENYKKQAKKEQQNFMQCVMVIYI